MRALAAALGDPQHKFPSVLIAGTNGKGSTAATLASILTAAGYRTALYTSPHLVRVNERIQISTALSPTEYASADVPSSAGPGTLHPIPDEDFGRLYFHVDAVARHLLDSGVLPHRPSFFEILTAIAFCYFAEKKVDIAILEVGLGGRLDATNIVEPLISVITDIALDHMDYLGSTIAEITREKCGILRPFGTLITLPQHPEANQAIGEAAASLNLRAISAADFIPSQLPSHETATPDPNDLHLPHNHYTLTLDGAPLEVDSPLPGQHQQRNIALAIAAAVELRNQSSNKSGRISNKSSYKISNTDIEDGIRTTHWPGRLELLPNTTPPILLDVAHNPAGAWTLRAAIAQLPESQPRTLIFSCLRDKSLTEMARILLPLFDSSADGSPSRPHDHIIFAPINSPRAASVESLLAAAHDLDIPAHAAPHVAGALAQARKITPPNGIIIVTGSVYLIGELRQHATATA
jgi:dihydrofolate synthase/folylpolyglutamate synthase